MNSISIILKSNQVNITYSQLKKLKVEYWEHLERNKFPPPPKSGKAIETIMYFKRKDNNKPITIGIYHNITPFEAANRIASDLVIINGVLQLIEAGVEPKNSNITVRLGTKHIVGKGDFTINENVGEAFNVAESFLPSKLHKTRKKWKDYGKDLKYILINGEALKDNSKINDTRIFKVKDWDK